MRYATLVTNSRVKSIRVFRLLVGIVILVCLLISTFSYIRIYLIVRRHQLEIDAQQQAVQSSNAENLNVARLKRSAINTFVFYIALIICYFPMFVIMTLNGASNMDWRPEWEFAVTVYS